MSRPTVIHDRVRDVELLLPYYGPHELARRLGYRNVADLRRIMRRAGRHDLSNRLGDAIDRYRRAAA